MGWGGGDLGVRVSHHVPHCMLLLLLLLMVMVLVLVMVMMMMMIVKLDVLSFSVPSISK